MKLINFTIWFPAMFCKKKRNMFMFDLNDLKSFSRDELIILGFGNFDGELFLFQEDWIPFIPEDCILATIFGNQTTIRREISRGNTDERYGFLSFGILISNKRTKT